MVYLMTCLMTPLFPCGSRRRRRRSDPSPVSPRLVKAPAASHPLPCGEGNGSCAGADAPDKILLPSPRGEGGPRRAFSPAVAGRMRVCPERPAANEEYPFILLRTPADKRSGGVSGALRGGAKNGKRDAGFVLAARHVTRHLSVSSRPAPCSSERVGKSRTGIDRAYAFASPAPKGYLVPFLPRKY